MTERLDKIEELLLTTAKRLDETNATLSKTNTTLEQVAEQHKKNTTDIDNLVAAISTTDVKVQQLSDSVAANEKRFNILIQEMRSDRRTSQQAFNALLLQLANVNGRIDDLEQKAS